MTAVIPSALRRRPQHKGLPVPYVNETDAGEVDFSAIYAPRVLRCAQQQRCGLCGRSLAGARGVLDCAFLGGPLSAETGAYTDPPMHRICTEAALELCCHISRPATRRRAGRADDYEPAGFVAEKPAEWVIYVTTIFRWSLDPANGITFFPGPAIRRDRYSYDEDGSLRLRDG